MKNVANMVAIEAAMAEESVYLGGDPGEVRKFTPLKIKKTPIITP